MFKFLLLMCFILIVYDLVWHWKSFKYVNKSIDKISSFELQIWKNITRWQMSGNGAQNPFRKMWQTFSMRRTWATPLRWPPWLPLTSWTALLSHSQSSLSQRLETKHSFWQVHWSLYFVGFTLILKTQSK